MSEDNNNENEPSGFRKFLRKAPKAIFEWLKNNWLVVLLAAAVSVLAWKGCDKSSTYESLFQKYKEQQKSHQEQLEKLEKIQKAEREAFEKELDRYQSELNRIEEDYNKKLDKIEESKTEEQEDILKEHEKDPHSLTERLRETFGIPVEE